MPRPLNGSFVVNADGELVTGQGIQIDDETGEVRGSSVGLGARVVSQHQAPKCNPKANSGESYPQFEPTS